MRIISYTVSPPLLLLVFLGHVLVGDNNSVAVCRGSFSASSTSQSVSHRPSPRDMEVVPLNNLFRPLRHNRGSSRGIFLPPPPPPVPEDAPIMQYGV